MPRLRRVAPDTPGWQRRRSGRGFRYLDEAGAALPAAEVERIKALVIPPAWEQVWICPDPQGHLQATGTDAAGAAVVGPAYIGAGVIVGNNALVRNSMVLERSEVGFTTEVARSYVAERCAMHACRVLDSVFAPGVNFSAGCTTANRCST